MAEPTPSRPSKSIYTINGILVSEEVYVRHGKQQEAEEKRQAAEEKRWIAENFPGFDQPNAAGVSVEKIKEVNKTVEQVAVVKPKEEAQPLEDNGSWIKTPIGGFRLGEPFTKITDQIKYEIKDNLNKAKVAAGVSYKGILSYLEEIEQQTVSSNNYPGYTDSSIGGNDALNPLWQYNLDDDIIWPNMRVPPHQSGTMRGLGRVYAETFDSTQHILWLSFGIPKFAPLERFYKNAAKGAESTNAIMNDKMLNKTNLHQMNKITDDEGSKLASYLVPNIFVGMYKEVVKVANGAADALAGVYVNQYYEFVPKMHVYYKAVITILAHLTIGLNLTPNGTKQLNNTEIAVGATGITDALEKELQNDYPDILRKGPDILYILSKRSIWKGGREGSPNITERITEAIMDKVVNETHAANSNTLNIGTPDPNEVPGKDGDGNTTTSWSKWVDDLKEKAHPFLKGVTSVAKLATDSALKDLQYIGFRIERGTDQSESVSNSIGQAEITGKLNGMVATAKSTQFSTANGNLGDSNLGKALNKLVDLSDTITRKVGDVAGVGDAIQLVSKGSGYFDIPEVWKDSSCSKSYSFDIKLHARYGDPLSIYQCIYIPLAMLIAGSFPVGLGGNTYTSPFLCQAFSKGMFSIPTGMIDSITIKRGMAEHGWTLDHLPTAVDVTLSIKDLSPALYISIANADANMVKFINSNDSMKAYLGTLAGLDIIEMTHKVAMLNRRKKAMLMINKATILNPRFHAIGIGNSKFARAAATLLPPSQFKARTT